MRRLALPVVDLAASEAKIATTLRAAAIEHGFFYLQGHGISRARFRETFGALEGFFARPEQDKLALHKSRTGNFRGYIGLFEQGDYGVDETDQRGKAGEPAKPDPLDFKEVFHIGTELAPDHPRYSDVLYSANVWPAGDADFRASIEAYYGEVFGLSNTMLEMFALALEVDRDFFLSASVETPMNSMNCVHYPPMTKFPGEPSADQLGIGAHTDFEAFTLLAQHGPKDPCLDIYLNGAWTPVPPLEDTFVVNIGDQLSRWTGGLFRSTVHRARNHATQDRTSIAFFRAPDFDAMISSERVPGGVEEYAPVLAGQHMLDRIERANKPLL